MPWFWQAVLLLIVAVPVVTLFCYAVWDVLRRPGYAVLGRIAWMVAFCIVPIIGPLIYLALRPPGTTATERAMAEGGASAANELEKLAALHDRDKLTDEEYQNAKEQHIGSGAPTYPTVRQQRSSGA